MDMVFNDRDLNHWLGEYNNIIGWGTGGAASATLERVKINIKYFIDNNQQKIGTTFSNREVKSSNVLKEEDTKRTLIIIFSCYYTEIKDQIRELGNFDIVNHEFILLMQNEIKEIVDIPSKDTVFTLSSNNYTRYLGGTEKFIIEQVQYINNIGIDTYHIYPFRIDIINSENLILGIIVKGDEKFYIALHNLLNILEKRKAFIKEIIIHNLIGFNKQIISSIIDASKRIKTIYYVHDYSCICESYNLMYNDKKFCNAPYNEFEICKTCCHYLEMKKRVEFHKNLFKQKNVQVITPSNYTQDIITTVFNNINVITIPHQEYSICNNKKQINHVVKIGYIGYKSYVKGWDIFKSIVSKYSDRYEFYCFGLSDEKLENVTYVDVSFQTEGQEAMVNKMNDYKIDIALLWSIWPETYSYTYYESYKAGALVITNAISGNIAAQVAQNKNGVIFNTDNELYEFLNDTQKVQCELKKNKKKIDKLEVNQDILTLLL